ncbi:p21-activated protein kinase-interacting protein 1-like [Termitomyces sp. T112]|nr:hypothetical protein C0989_011862 [Termitomyces sp. Mn162]KAG5725069.1 p21-activated protein kinase-interacting protein 1-like [Termitomyces sp. T112]
MAKEKRTSGQALPPLKKARLEEKARMKAKAEQRRPVVKTKTTTTKNESQASPQPKFSLRIKGSPRPGKGKGKEKEKTRVAGKEKRRRDDDNDEEDENDDEEDKDEDDSDDDEPNDAPAPVLTKPKTTIKPPQARVLPRSFKIVAGSYEKLLYGLEGTVSLSSSSSSPEYTFTLDPIFIFPAHVSCIKAVAASPEGGKWLATGSADEIVKVWDLRRRKEIGGLMHHEGSITHLVFPSRSHLLSASEDGTLCLFRARDWSVLRALKGHKGRVNCVAVHPTGKVALSVGKDKALRMWDLMRGRGSASTKLGKEGEIVRWSTDGSLFAVQTGSTIDLYTTSMEILHTINHPSRLHDLRFCKRVVGDGELLLATAEDKLVSVYDVSSDPQKAPKIIAAMTGHTNRVKAVQTLDITLPCPPSPSADTSQRKATTIACTVSSDGFINVYDLAMVPASDEGQEKVDIAPVAAYDTKGTRLTCLTIADGDMVSGEAKAGEKRKEREGEEEEDESEEEGVEEWLSEQEEEEEEEEEMESD